MKLCVGVINWVDVHDWVLVFTGGCVFDPFTSYEVTVSIYKRNCTLCAFELKPESPGINQLINNRCLKFVYLFLLVILFFSLSSSEDTAEVFPHLYTLSIIHEKQKVILWQSKLPLPFVYKFEWLLFVWHVRPNTAHFPHFNFYLRFMQDLLSLLVCANEKTGLQVSISMRSNLVYWQIWGCACDRISVVWNDHRTVLGIQLLFFIGYY